MRSLLVLAMLTAASPAVAAPPGETPSGELPLETLTIHTRPAKRASTATVLTLAGVAVPFALTYLTYEPNTDNPMYAPIGGITGLILPAIGHWYSGRVGTYGMLMRLGGLMFAMVGLSYLDDADRCARGEQVTDGCHLHDRTVGRVSVGLGLATWAGSWVYDVVSARREVRRYNRRYTVQLGPLRSRDATGLSLAGTF